MKKFPLKKVLVFSVALLVALSFLLFTMFGSEIDPVKDEPNGKSYFEDEARDEINSGSVFHQKDSQSPYDTILVNGVSIARKQAVILEEIYGVQILPGIYWYDPVSGAWGFPEGPTEGFILPGLDLGGPLRADASGGTTHVFINGRRLPVQDLWHLQQLVGNVQPGRYWLDARGFAGYEGGPAIVNLAQLARQAETGRGHVFHRSWATEAGAGASGGTGYVMGKDWSVTFDY